MTNKDITNPKLRSMLAGDLLAIRRLRGLSIDTRYWMRVQAATTYHRVQLQINTGGLA
jgi:hypothetical protein